MGVFFGLVDDFLGDALLDVGVCGAEVVGDALTVDEGEVFGMCVEVVRWGDEEGPVVGAHAVELDAAEFGGEVGGAEEGVEAVSRAPVAGFLVFLCGFFSGVGFSATHGGADGEGGEG